MAQVGAIIMKHMLEELTATQLLGPVLSIGTPKCIYMVNNAWQTEARGQPHRADY